MFGSSAKSETESVLIVHFGHHKAMTMLFKQILSAMAERMNWHYCHHNSDRKGFYSDALELMRSRVVSLNDSRVDFDRLPPYLGSHVIRDPRDLLISGYRYHLWCDEKWATGAMSQNMLDRLELEQLGLEGMADGKSYQQLLNAVDTLDGMRIELNWRQMHFERMQQWDYQNPLILEMKYEEIFGHERSYFARLFSHYQIKSSHVKPLLKLVDRIAFAKLKSVSETGPRKHATVGALAQWRTELPESLRATFKDRHGELLVKLGYETGLDW